MKGYGQFCPVAKAAEILCERWTMLVVRELICGSQKFNDLRRGVPLLSPTLLSKRLKWLEQAGIVRHQAQGRGRSGEYSLTPAGEELQPLIVAFGTWGQRWARQQMRRGDLDPSLLMWDVHRNIKPEQLPRDKRTVIAVEFSDVKADVKSWWLVVEAGKVDICLDDPGFEVDVLLRSDIRCMIGVWMGDLDLADAIASGRLRVAGPRSLVTNLRAWLGLSPFADVERAVEASELPWLHLAPKRSSRSQHRNAEHPS